MVSVRRLCEAGFVMDSVPRVRDRSAAETVRRADLTALEAEHGKAGADNFQSSRASTLGPIIAFANPNLDNVGRAVDLVDMRPSTTLCPPIPCAGSTRRRPFPIGLQMTLVFLGRE